MADECSVASNKIQIPCFFSTLAAEGLQNKKRRLPEAIDCIDIRTFLHQTLENCRSIPMTGLRSIMQEPPSINVAIPNGGPAITQQFSDFCEMTVLDGHEDLCIQGSDTVRSEIKIPALARFVNLEFHD